MKRSILAVAVIAAVLAGCSVKKLIRPTTNEVVDKTEARVKRGQYLVDSVAGCGVCHTGRTNGSTLRDLVVEGERTDLYLAGGMAIKLPAMGNADLRFPNITQDKKDGLGDWSDDEIIRALRDGIAKDGHLLFPMMPFAQFQHLSDEDVRSVVAYLRTVPAIESKAPFAYSSVGGFGGFMLRHGAAHHEPVKHVAEPDRADKVKYGSYLSHLAQCPDCHSGSAHGPRKESDPLWMAGGFKDDLPGVGTMYSRNLTPDMDTGLGKYSADQIKQSIRSGTRLDGKKMAPPMAMMIPHYSTMTDEDLDAVVAYLRSLKPVKNKVPDRKLEPEFAKAYGDS